MTISYSYLLASTEKTVLAANERESMILLIATASLKICKGRGPAISKFNFV